MDAISVTYRPTAARLPGELVRDTADLDRFFRINSRSFWFAARWFRAEQRNTVRRVYAFCRVTDDIVDRATDDAAAAEGVAAWRTLLSRGYEGGGTEIPWLDALLAESRSAKVPFGLIEDLLDGVTSDIGGVAIESWEEFDNYCYRVGSVVGLWLCRLFGVSDDNVLARARALGHAMQITNIVRDVGEDLSLGRVYIPMELLAQHSLDMEKIRQIQVARRIPREYQVVLATLIERAEQLYSFAATGIPALPKGFRSAVAVASAVYRGIQDEVVGNGYDNLTRRAKTSSLAKLSLAVRALFWLRKAQPELRRRPPALIDITSEGDIR